MSRFCYYNPNPEGKITDDCTIRAISKLTGQDWHTTYLGITAVGYLKCEMPSTNNTWETYLLENGYKCYGLYPYNTECETVRDFCYRNPNGKYLLALDGHVVTVVDGYYYDTWDSGSKRPLYYWTKE